MPAVRFDVSEHEEIGRYLGKAFEQVAERALLATALRVVNRIQNVVIPGEPQPPIDRRIYAAGWRARRVGKGATIENTVPHAGFIEHGVRAGNVKVGRKMIDALAAWVMRKGFVGRPKGRKAQMKAAAEARGIAWAIAMKMTKRGIFGPKGLRILEKGLKFVEKFFEEELRRELKREW